MYTEGFPGVSQVTECHFKDECLLILGSMCRTMGTEGANHGGPWALVGENIDPVFASFLIFKRDTRDLDFSVKYFNF